MRRLTQNRSLDEAKHNLGAVTRNLQRVLHQTIRFHVYWVQHFEPREQYLYA